MAEFEPPEGQDLLNLHPADIADRLQRLSPEEARAWLEKLPSATAAGTLRELDEGQFREIAEGWGPAELARLLRELPAQAVADLAGDLPPEQRQEVLGVLPAGSAESARVLLRYPEDTAGGIMSDRFIALQAAMTVTEAREALRPHAEEERQEEVGYLYVTDGDGGLVGVVSLRDLVFRRGERLIGEIANRQVKFLRVEDDQETIARQFEHYHYLGLPVLDKDNRLVGVVKASEALNIAQKEATEDMQLMVGLSGEERTYTPWRRAVRHRLPWLYVNVGTAFLAATVVSQFESTIAQWTALAVFLPIIGGQAGNAGMQALIVVVRDLALGELSPGEGRRALFKEIVLGVVNGLAVGLLVGVIGSVWKGSMLLGVVAATAMMLSMVAAGIAGVLIPLGLRLLRVDPALASGIFLSTVTDVSGFLFFLGIATVVLRKLAE